MTEEKPRRVFLAMDMPGSVKVYLTSVQETLKYVLENVRWTRPKGIHLTLKFFGNIVQSDIARISDVVERNTKKVSPLILGIEHMGAFPNLQRPRVLWLGVSGEVDKLKNLQTAIDDDLDRCGFPKEGKKFSPHLTLGRARSSRGIILGLPEAANRLDRGEIEPFQSTGLTLFQSELKPGGAVYTVLRHFPFERMI